MVKRKMQNCVYNTFCIKAGRGTNIKCICLLICSMHKLKAYTRKLKWLPVRHGCIILCMFDFKPCGYIGYLNRKKNTILTHLLHLLLFGSKRTLFYCPGLSRFWGKLGIYLFGHKSIDDLYLN